MTRQPLWVILCRLPEKGRRAIVVGEMKERDRGERKMNGVKKQKKQKHSPSSLTCCKPLPNCKPISVGHPGDVRYTTPLPHPTIPGSITGR